MVRAAGAFDEEATADAGLLALLFPLLGLLEPSILYGFHRLNDSNPIQVEARLSVRIIDASFTTTLYQIS